MTDKEIIQALECCIKPTSDCDNCPYYGYDDDLQCFDMSKRDALELINRQQETIERLKKAVEIHKGIAEDWKYEAKKLKEMVGEGK